ncbi:MAG: cyclic beta 1-2 glucan synthetase [Ferruginibacter sp.]|nr:cyclic beta 1-2 glucan synthetase [Ferruginibacter sp.]
MLPQAIVSFKRNIIEPIFGDNLNEKFADNRPPLRSELFTEEQLEYHARWLATKHILISEHPSEQLLKRLAENEKILLEVHALLTEVVKEKNGIAPAGEWLLDNFFLVEEQIYTGKKHLPKGYSKGLPQLSKGKSAGLPRVYDIAVEIISHSDGHVDIKSLVSFVKAYQTSTFLKLGELWAIPIMLRLALIENLRRLSIQIAIDINNKSTAGQWADKILETVEKDPKNLVLVIADMARSEPPMDSSFVAELTRRLQEKGSLVTLPLTWIEQRLSENGATSSELIQEENQKQAADQVSISNSISSLRFLSTTDWRDFVESTSIVEETLCGDIDGVYGEMDFLTRDNYRHAVEKIAKNSHLSEQEVAAMAIQFARNNKEKNNDVRASHVGYYLTCEGLSQIRKQAKVRVTKFDYCRNIANKSPLFVYLGGIFLLTGLFTWGLVAKAYDEGLSKTALGLLSLAVLLATSRLAVSIINWLSTILARPHLLPRMDYSKGIPQQYRTMVVIPTILSNLTVIDELIEGLEVRFLANRDANLYYALLTDFKDAPAETLPEDDQLLQTVKQKIVELNKKYDRSINDIFFLFHRPRKWNVKDKVWMGYERKRGKLEQFNTLVRGGGKEFFSMIVGEEGIYTGIKYVITLDTDTQMPRDTAWKMVATLAHPLNHALYNENKGRVTEGYAILQPRVSNSLAGSNSSLYARIHGNEPGTDPYTRAISDVYQDLFKEGSFIGKGIYDVDAFEQALKNKFPPNRILSHDLLEGCYARSGLISDVQLYEEYPSLYLTDMKRRHRWIRGDWQIASWIYPFVPGVPKGLRKNPLSLFSKWKIFDNIRRSLVPLSLLLLFLFGWIISPLSWFWTLAVTLIIIMPSVVNFIWELCRKPDDVIFVQHLIYTLKAASNHFVQHLLDLICLPYEVFSNMDAILKTLVRIIITKRKLLQWNPYSYSQHKKESIDQSFFTMWIAPFFSIAVFVYLVIYQSTVTILIALPILILWITSPFIAWWASHSFTAREPQLSNSENLYLRKLGRKIWVFFEDFVGEADNWLPPDNYQVEPVERIAHRTSPTNIGLALLCNLTAYDFGYIGPRQLIDRTNNTINTLLRMERYRGHLYNWYDTRTLVPLAPKYISTVDSGNLAGHLITLKQGLLAIPGKRIFSMSTFEGLADTVGLLADLNDNSEILQQFQEELQDIIQSEIRNLEEANDYINELQQSFAAVYAQIKPEASTESAWWAQKIILQIQQAKYELIAMVPWIILPRAPQKFEHLISMLPLIPTTKELAKIEENLLHSIISCYSPVNSTDENEWLNNFRTHITESARRAKELILTAEQLALKSSELANIEYDFLYDKSQHLLTIGFNVDEQRRDNSFYDLLASEARLTTFVAIAQGKLPQESWFALGRQLTKMGTTPILLSWSGSMFEYLMPLLVMPTYDNTLLDQTNTAIIEKQIEYGRKRGVPWGISESGYNMVDTSLNYQYRAFGVPGLGLKRGLSEDLVISPYSTVMALMVSPQAAYNNLRVLKENGFESKYGFYEAIDYTPSRLSRKQTYSVIRSFMAHHQGMSFLSLAYLLLEKPMQQRFETDVEIKSALLLLQEKVPRVATFYSPTVHAEDISAVAFTDSSMRVINTPNTVIPEVELLSNGRYHVMVTNSGGGYSRWKNIAVTRWREDSTRDNWGTFCYIRDLDTNAFWSTAFQPTLQQGENYEAVFTQGRAEFRRRDYSLDTHTEIVVSPEDDIELRRVHITNRSRKKRYLEITSYAEVVLTSALADEIHPAFSNLFVQTEINRQRHAIICTRRPRSVDEHNPWMFHLMKVHDAEIRNISYETNRPAFIGRGNTIHHPSIMQQGASLSNTAGSVLDPVVAIQYRIIIEPGETCTIDMIIGIAETKEICNNLVEKYQDRHLTKRVLELAWTHSLLVLRQINATEADAQLYARLTASVIFGNASLRADPDIIIKNRRGQSGLWGYSISGDLPIVLLLIEDAANFHLVKQMVQAHSYWRLKGILIDLVIWNEDRGGYRQDLHNLILGLITPAMSADVKDQPGGIFIRAADQVSNEDRILFQTVAHIVLSDKMGSLEEQINRRNKIKFNIPYFNPTKFHSSVATAVAQRTDLLFFNGFGGFTQDGREYVITTAPSNSTPAPWINVLANPHFGCIISESGQSYTWIDNAHEFRLTPWNNDPINDLEGEAFYLRDEESGRFWSPSPFPSCGKSPYITRHGFGYSIFEHSEDGIDSEMCVYTDTEAPVKFIVLKLRNNSNRLRRISATGYVEWVLGDLRSKTQMHIITDMDARTGAILATNAYNTEFAERVAFFDVDDMNKSYTADRAEFIGRNGVMSNPEAMNKSRLSGRLGATLDPCAALQVVFDLSEEEEHEVIFRLGSGKNLQDTLSILQQFAGTVAAHSSLKKVHAFWEQTLSKVEIETPDAAVNLLANGWLTYQTIACRIWARSGFYQSGGAFGFRDQLQDTLSLMHAQPNMVKQQILLCASRQFKEGDVQHWWHPPMGRGVRTTCSDDYLWLPFVTVRYAISTGDYAILDEPVHFIEGRLLNAGEESFYDLPIQSNEIASLYEHCKIAIDHALKFGVHGLPLIGSGDWNDGMDRVGSHGKGESVWLAFFLYEVLKTFTALARLKNDEPFFIKCIRQAELLQSNIEKNAWDGEWYRRAYFDDGTPLGSVENVECKIDSIAQSWSVLSTAGDPKRIITAMESADKHLVRRSDKIIQLFDPPFDQSDMNPGYIKGYVPGVRENGGQYTHAAVWLVMAFAAMGNKQKTWELLQMINPVNHGKDADLLAEYKVEPYVVAADVYGETLNKGRGGWTWYTGSAGWMYQLIIDSFIGLKKEGNMMHFKPCIPPEWPSVKIQYRYEASLYKIQYQQSSGQTGEATTVLLDGTLQPGGNITLVNDGLTHEVIVRLKG